MNDQPDSSANPAPQGADGAAPATRVDAEALEPLQGEPGIPDIGTKVRQPMSKKGLLAVALLLVSVAAVLAFWIAQFAASGKKADDEDSKRVGNRPMAATAEPRRLDMTLAAPVVKASAAPSTEPHIPALIPTAEERAEPIGVRRTGERSPPSGGRASIPPEDAPVLLMSAKPGTSARQPASSRAQSEADAGTASDEAAAAANPLDQTRQNLQAYQRQLQVLMESLTRTTAGATTQAPVLPSGAPFGVPPIGGPAGAPASPAGGNLFGGQLQGSTTPRTAATQLGNRSLTMPKGTVFTCALKTKVISAASGFVGCQVQRNVFSDNGRVLLIERGSHLDGEYRASSVRPGTVRIPVLWTRIRTPNGVTVDIDSPGTGPLGESGMDGYVDNRWPERIGAAMLVSLINDAVQLVIQNQANDVQGDTIILPSTTSSTSKLAEKVLESTINIPPLIYQNQGGIVGIYVARDVDFSSVYALRPTPPQGDLHTSLEGRP